MYATNQQEAANATAREQAIVGQPADLWALPFTLALVALICFAQNAMKLFWYDELITLRIAKMGSVGTILRFYESGKDTTSFLPAMIVHLVQQLPGRPEVTTRIPFTFAYLITCLCIWLFLRRRYAPGYAMGAVFFFAQGWSLYFASEIRSYAFLVMGAAIGIACWQAAGVKERFQTLSTVGVFLGLSTAILFHFFGIFLFVPFAVAEWFYSRRHPRLRWGMWLAICLFPLSTIIMLPNMMAAHRTYAGSFWSKPTLGLLTESYVTFAIPLGRDLGEFVLLFALGFWLLKREKNSNRERNVAASGFAMEEWALLLGVALVPFLAFLGAQVLGVYRTQYVLYFHVALVILVAAGVAEILHRRAASGWLFAGFMLLLLAVHARDRISSGVHLLAGKPASRLPSEYEAGWVDYLASSNLPIVADGADTLLIAKQYAPETLQPRITLLTSHQRGAEDPHAMTNELNMEIFGPTLNLPTTDYDQFVGQHRDFLLLVNPVQTEFTWLYASLLRQSETSKSVHMTQVFGDVPVTTDQVFLVHFDSSAQPPQAM